MIPLSFPHERVRNAGIHFRRSFVAKVSYGGLPSDYKNILQGLDIQAATTVTRAFKL